MKFIVTLREDTPNVTTHQIMVHYIIGGTTNVDRFQCTSWESDISTGVLRLIDGRDEEGSVTAVQYRQPWRIMIR